MPNRILCVIAIAGLLPATTPAQQVTVLRGATVLTMTGSPPLPDADVAVRGDRIVHVGPRGSYRAARGARIVNAAGRWLVPGFIDMHAHVALGPVSGATTGRMSVRIDSAGIPLTLRHLLDFGITTIRDPAAPAALAVAIRDSVARGRLAGPRIVTAGEAIDALAIPNLTVGVRTAEEMRAEVRRQAALGVDWIKLYASLGAPLVRAGIEEAHAQGRKVMAHLFATSWTEAADAGIDGIVHAMPGHPRLLPAERRPAFRAGIHNSRFMLQWFEHVDLASPVIDSMITALVAHRVAHDPTLVVFEAMAWGDSARITQSPDLAMAPPALLENWRTDFQLTLGWAPSDYDSARAVWPTVLRFVRLLYDRGVFLVAGTDANNPWLPPGPSFHRELELLVAAGIPTDAVLRIATRNGAEALGILDSAGTIEPGQRADLVLLEGNPLMDIRNTRRIAWVMLGGHMLASSEPHPD